MIKVLAVPSYGYNVEKVAITRLLKEPGEVFALDEPLYELETDKVAQEVEAPFAARLVRWWVAEGDVVPVGAPVADVEVEA
ncbi:phenylalanine racemase [Paramagnetospirillum caucaseum]|uniref:Phenylalanine racemase n=1 Tax=Paramagnetospirillum caucaseum TaxID=1244869 RepID=M2ZPY9_9PROT|nr:lipoyl domain-containing protein [Paramagnetospirillum caucaseum]EME69372.1 phenylalanine racemase [Paramagnetospirillum caucaseum]